MKRIDHRRQTIYHRRSTIDSQLSERAAKIGGYRPLAYLQLIGNVFGGVPLRHQHSDLKFTASEVLFNIIWRVIQYFIMLSFRFSNNKSLPVEYKAA